MLQPVFMQKIFLGFWILSCCSCANGKPCNTGTPKQIQTIFGSNNGEVSYSHEIEVKGASFGCDSASIMGAIKKYIELNPSDTPIRDITVFKSMENFDKGESLSQPKAYYDDQVITVYFDEETNSPKSFAFYDGGHKVYEGNRWKQ